MINASMGGSQSSPTTITKSDFEKLLNGSSFAAVKAQAMQAQQTGSANAVSIAALQQSDDIPTLVKSAIQNNKDVLNAINTTARKEISGDSAHSLTVTGHSSLQATDINGDLSSKGQTSVKNLVMSGYIDQTYTGKPPNTLWDTNITSLNNISLNTKDGALNIVGDLDLTGVLTANIVSTGNQCC